MAETESAPAEAVTAAPEEAPVEEKPNAVADAPVEAAEKAEADGAEAKAEAGAEAEEAKKEESIYDKEPRIKLIVGRNHPLAFYVERARDVLRVSEDLVVSGRAENIAATCKLVESLKRQRIATCEKISTGMNVEPYFTPAGEYKWGPPSAIVQFVLKRGEFGSLIGEYQQRKVTEIFEAQDDDKSGEVTVEKLTALNLGEAFKANPEQLANAEKFLESKKVLNLPEFIRYTSILIHPLLKTKVFKEALSTKFNMEVSGVKKKEEEESKEE